MIRNFEFVGFRGRLVAKLIDWTILSFVIICVFLVINFAMLAVLFLNVEGMSYSEISKFANLLGIIAFSLSVFVSIIFYAIYEIFMLKKNGQTIGKKLLGIKVIKTNGESLTWSTAIIREIGEIINAFTIGIGYLIIIFDDKKQGLHDKIADTYVVKVK